ncbi:Xylulose kinase [Smittium mucronatum]|uniref:Xylulose kinase n=1 Tax=Smittium mucronatum TaxID=133383 RepID=A0A1R0GYI3_9FUNG|nr:Xylulose kinase [Smittium mucronatum]
MKNKDIIIVTLFSQVLSCNIILMALFLGLDLSTQQLKGVVIRDDFTFVYETLVVFDLELPQYKTTKGRVLHKNGVVTSPVLMWVDAISLLFCKLKNGLGDRIADIASIGGAAQQHGSVYWKDFENIKLDNNLALSKQFETHNVFTVTNSPTWEDSSTTEYCNELSSLHTPQKIAIISGSVPYERFTGNQISKVQKEFPEIYNNTERISLVSSFLPSILLGLYAPIEVSDASGMNLLDVQTRKWSQVLCDQELLSKLGPDPVFFGTAIGTIHDYFVSNYGFNKKCMICSMTGDNPGNLSFIDDLAQENSLNTHSPNTKLTIVVSLGTSDTIIFPIKAYPYSFENLLPSVDSYTGSILSHPNAPNEWAVLICYKNGSLAREFICNNLQENINNNPKLVSDKWGTFEKAYNYTQISPDQFGFYYILPEIIPKAKGIHRFTRISSREGHDRDSVVQTPSSSLYKHELISSIKIIDADARLIIKSQVMSMKLDCLRKNLDVRSDIEKLVITGGASKNDLILQTIADVFGLPTYTIDHDGDLGDESKDVSSLSMPAMAGAMSALKSFQKNFPPNASNSFNPTKSTYFLKLAKPPIHSNSLEYMNQMADFTYLRDYLASHT